MDLDPRLLELLHEWQERRAADIADDLTDICRDRPELASPLARLIAAVGRVDTLFAAAAGIALPLVPGFRLLAEVGRGGMGVVYRAVDTTLDREVAVKVPLVAVVDRRASERFVREGRALARLLHPHIVPVYSAGVAAGTPYLVMRFVPGGSLAARVDELRARPGHVAALLGRVARAVDHAHLLGITHRDLKPSNILLGENDQPFVSDFGVAALVAGEAVSSGSADTPPDATAPTPLTRTGVAVGTPAYAAPEVESGGPARLAPAVDIWALGVILSECLTGRPPIRGAGVTLPPTVPAGLARIVRRCLAGGPADRYPTAAALANALEGWVRRRRWWRRAMAVGRWGLALTLAVVIVFAVTGPENRHAFTADLLRHELEGGGVTLIGDSGWPRTHRVRCHRDLVATGLTGDGVFFASCPRPCLVEFLPSLSADRFSLTADLCHAAGLGDTAVGVYAGHARLGDGADTEHRFVCLTFTDCGVSKTAYTGPGGRAGGAVSLHAFALRPGDPPEGAWRRFGLGREWHPPTDAAEGQVWRRVRLDVGPDAMTGVIEPPEVDASWSPVRLPPARVASLSDDLSSPAYPRGGVGLYVHSGKVLVRNVRVIVRPSP